jgi:hypothetical protein
MPREVAALAALAVGGTALIFRARTRRRAAEEAAVWPLPVSATSRKVFGSLEGFLQSRQVMQTAAAEAMPQRLMLKYDSFDHSMAQPQSTYEELLALGEKALPILHRTFSTIVEEADPNLPADGVAMHRHAADEWGMHRCMRIGLLKRKGLYFKHLTLVPLKPRARCEEKVGTEYGGAWSRLLDVVRCSIVMYSEEQLCAVADTLVRRAQPLARLVHAAVGDYAIVRLKNRFRSPCFNGYQDALYSVALCVGAGQWVVCEVQLHHTALLIHKETSHPLYECMRPLFGCGGGDGSAVDGAGEGEGEGEGEGTVARRVAMLEQLARGGCPGETSEELLARVLASAEAATLEALRQLLQLLGDARGVAAVERRQAAALEAQGQPEAAELLHRRALARADAALGTAHPEALSSVRSLAANLLARGERRTAQRLLRQRGQYLSLLRSVCV